MNIDDLSLMKNYETDQVEIDREISARSLYDFIDLAWHQVEPARKYFPNWHIKAICEHLEAVTDKEINRLIINVPPSTMKSLTCCVFFPAWLWTKHPERRTIYASYSEVLAKRDSLKCRRIIDSEWYQKRWGHLVKPIADQWTSSRFSNQEGGLRLITTIEGGITGEHADIQIVDDPVKPLEIANVSIVTQNTLQKVTTWWDGTMSSRMLDFETSARVIIMQRLHEGDLAGHALASEGEDYEHLMLPMEFEPKRKCFTSIGFEDPREEEGELLWPERMPQKAVDNIKIDLGPRGAQAQLQQNPTPEEGSLFKKSSASYYAVRPEHFTTQLQSWDCTFKETLSGSFVVGQLWGALGTDYYLLDEIRARMSFTETCRAIRRMSAKWPRSYTKLIEAKANGDAIVDHLKRELNGLMLLNPEGGKITRANAIEPIWEDGRIHIPNIELAPWIVDWLDEITGFPNKMNDDRVDAMSQALIYLESKSIEKLRRAMANVRI